jgi:hypothetical protein
MKNHTKLAYAQDVFNDPSVSFSCGFNARVAGHTYNECFTYPHERSDGARQNGWDSAARFIDEGKIYSVVPFHDKDCDGTPFPYGGTWVCNTCGESQLNKPWWNVKVYKDGSEWICVGENFVNLQESENFAFGSTRKEAIANYGKLMQEQATN